MRYIRTSFSVAQLCLIVATCGNITLVVGCGSDRRPVAKTEAKSPSSTSASTAASPALVAVPTIHFDTMEPISADQLREAQRFLDNPALDRTAANFGTLGMLCHGFDLQDAAQACYENASRLAPTDYRWPYLSAQLDRDSGQLDRAIEHLRSAIELMDNKVLNVQRAAAHCWLGRIEQEAGQLADAQTDYQAAIAIDRNCTYAQFGLARVAVAEDRFDDAERHLKLAAQLQPDTGAIQHLMGTVLRRLGRTEESAELLRAAAANHSNIELLDPIISAMLALPISSRKHQNRGNKLFEEGHFEEAIAEFSDALELARDDALSHCNRGAALQKVDRLTEAETEFRAALQIDPQMIVARFNLGVVLSRQGEDDEAIGHYETILLAVPTHKDSLFNLANSLCRVGRIAEARVCYANLLAVDPANTKARVAEARACLMEGDAASAISRLQQAYELDSDDLQIRHELARLLVATPELPASDAERGLQLALEVAQQHPLLAHVETVAMGYARQGNFDAAIELQQDAIAAAERAKRTDLAKHLHENLAKYQSGEPCRVPWRTEELLPQSASHRVADRTSE